MNLTPVIDFLLKLLGFGVVVCAVLITTMVVGHWLEERRQDRKLGRAARLARDYPND